MKRSLAKRNLAWMAAIAGSLLLLDGVGSLTASALTFPQPDGSGRPDRRRGAGSRSPGDCLAESPKTLYVLAPENPEDVFKVSRAQTAAARPDLFWYVPPTVSGAIAEVRIEQSNRGTVYQSSFALSGEEGIVRYRLPQGSALPTFQPGETYAWTVRLFCNEEAVLEEIPAVRITSEIQRATVSLPVSEDWSQQLGDALDLYCKAPAEAQQTWSRLMTSVDLSYFGQSQLLENSLKGSCPSSR